MPANSAPIYSRVADIQGGDILTTAANDYTGLSVYNNVVFTSDATNGGFIQRLRFKALGTNVASVARMYINNGLGRFASIAGSMSAITPTGTQSTTGGTMNTGTGITWYGMVYPIDPNGQIGTGSLEATAAATTSSSTGSIAWSWTAVNGAASYLLVTGTATGAERQVFTTTTNSYTQTVNTSSTREGIRGIGRNNFFFGEISLPATTAIATAATLDVDYPMGFAIPAGYRILVGLGTTVAAGWNVVAIGGAY